MVGAFVGGFFLPPWPDSWIVNPELHEYHTNLCMLRIKRLTLHPWFAIEDPFQHGVYCMTTFLSLALWSFKSVTKSTFNNTKLQIKLLAPWQCFKLNIHNFFSCNQLSPITNSSNDATVIMPPTALVNIPQQALQLAGSKLKGSSYYVIPMICLLIWQEFLPNKQEVWCQRCHQIMNMYCMDLEELNFKVW